MMLMMLVVMVLVMVSLAGHGMGLLRRVRLLRLRTRMVLRRVIINRGIVLRVTLHEVNHDLLEPRELALAQLGRGTTAGDHHVEDAMGHAEPGLVADEIR